MHMRLEIELDWHQLRPGSKKRRLQLNASACVAISCIDRLSVPRLSSKFQRLYSTDTVGTIVVHSCVVEMKASVVIFVALLVVSAICVVSSASNRRRRKLMYCRPNYGRPICNGTHSTKVSAQVAGAHKVRRRSVK